MKRKPTASNLRVGQTLYFLGHPHGTRKRVWAVGRVVVGSDKLPVPTPRQTCTSVVDTYPRYCLVAHLRHVPGDFSYSRRNVERLAKELNAKDAWYRANPHVAESGL